MSDFDDPAVWRTMTVAGVREKLPEWLNVSGTATEYWEHKPAPADVYFYGFRAAANEADRAAVSLLREGLLQTAAMFEGLRLGMPPSWDENPLENSTWDFYRHSLRWTEPLLRVWVTNNDDRAFDLWLAIIRDWACWNLPYPGQSKYAWFDHAAANRLRLLCWGWELYRTCGKLEANVARDLLALIFIHAVYVCDPAEYPGHSNHGLEMAASLLSAALTVSEFKHSKQWLELSLARLEGYIEQNLCPQGFHLEQSPFYHFYVLERLAHILDFLDKSSVLVSNRARDRLVQAVYVGAYLVKPDGLMPTIGDTPSTKPAVPKEVDLRDQEAPAQPRCIVSFSAGYAVLRAYQGLVPKAGEADTYCLFKCNAFRSPHFHFDALSFILFGLGRDWLIDSGQFNYEESSVERKYVRSARAHNTVLIDDAGFGTRPVVMLGHGELGEGYWVEVEHQLKKAVHRRRLEFDGGRGIKLRDSISFTDGRSHRVIQLFHAAPGILVQRIDGRIATLEAEGGGLCTIVQEQELGEWRAVTGQREPELLGWYSPGYGKLLPVTALMHDLGLRSNGTELVTRIVLSP